MDSRYNGILVRIRCTSKRYDSNNFFKPFFKTVLGGFRVGFHVNDTDDPRGITNYLDEIIYLYALLQSIRGYYSAQLDKCSREEMLQNL